MEVQLLPRIWGRKQNIRAQFLAAAGLEADMDADSFLLVWEGEALIATGCRKDNLLKCIAVDPAHQGEGLTATVLTHLRKDAFEAGYHHLFLYTKPRNEMQFTSLFFHTVAQTDQVLLMEDQPGGIGKFLDSLPVAHEGGQVGALVMNCNPFTLGHRHLIETATRECQWVYVFVLSEDKSLFPAQVRMELVKQGTEDLPNVTVLPTGPYLVSAATFPTYFLKEQASIAQCGLDICIFNRYFVPKFGITHRYVGTEPLSEVTNAYNRALKEGLSVPVREIPRLELQGSPISATAVRRCIEEKQFDALTGLVPPTTLDYIRKHF